MIYFNTKADFYNCLYDDMPSAIAKLKDILDDRYAWQLTAILEDKSQGIEDETHMVTENDGEISQLELKEDEYALLFRLGFTVKEAEEIIADPEKALADYQAQDKDEE